jgi:hypothetical protein
MIDDKIKMMLPPDNRTMNEVLEDGRKILNKKYPPIKCPSCATLKKETEALRAKIAGVGVELQESYNKHYGCRDGIKLAINLLKPLLNDKK